MGSIDVVIDRMDSTAGTSIKSPLMTLPNELLSEVASNLKRYNHLNSLVRTSRFFYAMFNPHLYRRTITATNHVLGNIVRWALKECRLGSLTHLLDNGLSIDRTFEFRGQRFKETMLSYLCGLGEKYDRLQLARLLIQRGADTKAKNSRYSDTALYKAISYGRCGIVALLLEHGADVNAAESDRVPPLLFASDMCTDNAEMVNLLLTHGANIEARSAAGDTALILSSQHKHRVMKALLEHGADAGVHNNRGEGPLHHACYWFGRDDRELAKSLLKHGADVDATDINGRTPLHWLFTYCGTDGQDELFLARLFLENGADVNAISNDGLSPLQCALMCLWGADPDVIALLLEYGADVGVLNGKEKQILRRAMANKRRA
jgi:ankyrin repeat protein